MIDYPQPTLLAIPAFILFVIIEMIYGWKTGRAKYNGPDTFTSLFMGFGSTLADLIGATFVYAIGYAVWENYRIFHFDPTIWVFALAFILDDFAYYWKHRFGHRIRWMWAAHVIHHSSQHYNLSTALRQTWTSRLTPGLLLSFPLFILGIEPAIIAFVAGLNLVYQFWIHTETIDKMPNWFEAIMNTPSHHRVHHAKNPRYLDANYAGVFIIWDKMFGSFIPETNDEACRYGLVSDLGTFNPLRVAFHEWIAIIRDMWGAQSWYDRMMFLVASPGWTPDGSRLTSEMLRRRWQRLEAERQQNQGREKQGREKQDSEKQDSEKQDSEKQGREKQDCEKQGSEKQI